MRSLALPLLGLSAVSAVGTLAAPWLWTLVYLIGVHAGGAAFR